MKTPTWLLCAWLICASLFACGDDDANVGADNDAGNGSSSGNDGKNDGKQADAVLAVPDGNAPKKFWTKGAADPCNIDSGFPGDEYCIKPPDPSLGFQLHYGPANYDDPDEVAKYILMPDQEVTDCVFMTTPNETEVFHGEYHGRMRPGSHHMLVYTQDTPTPVVGDGPQDCNQGTQSRNIFGAQTPAIDLVQGSSGAPEDQGLAQRLMPKQQAIFQMHFINTTGKPILREAWANVVYMDESKVKQEADPIFFLAGIGARIQPGTTTISKGKAVAKSKLRLIEATGHYHAHTVRFSAWKTIGGVRELLFEDFDWHEPQMFSFNSVTKNPKAGSGAKGAFSGIVELAEGDMIDWECEVVNDSTKTLGFGNEVYGAEMCNMFGAYTPGTGQPWGAQNF